MSLDQSEVLFDEVLAILSAVGLIQLISLTNVSAVGTSSMRF